MEDTGSADAFTELGTLGVEEEFFVVDERGRPASGTDELVYESDPPELLAGRLDHELFKCVIETQTPTLERPAEAGESAREVRDALVEHARGHGVHIAGAGLHPTARWRQLEHAEKPRYRSQLERIQYPQHRNTTAGLHVHVGVDDGDKAVWVANELRWYVPLLLAASANSPYWNGFDTGLQSARAKIFEGLPNTGMPTAFTGIDDFLAYERRMLAADAIEDRGELWYDVRPHTEHGSVEVRTPDGQHDVAVVLAFVELVHARVVALAERYEDHPSPWERYETGAAVADDRLRRELLDENKWRAMRHGRAATFIERDGEGTVGLAEALDRLADRVGVSLPGPLLDEESGAERQRRLRERAGLDALRSSLLLDG
jgi:carboxylate-amine ligase